MDQQDPQPPAVPSAPAPKSKEKEKKKKEKRPLARVPGAYRIATIALAATTAVLLAILVPLSVSYYNLDTSSATETDAPEFKLKKFTNHVDVSFDEQAKEEDTSKDQNS